MLKVKEKQILDFKNDVLFKYTLTQDDPQSRYLLNLLISEIGGVFCDKFVIKNPDLTPHHIQDKDMILDIKAEDERGTQYDIEMQNSGLSQNLHQRFQIYGAKMLASQQKLGEDYVGNVRETIQIIFVNDVDKDNMKLIDVYTSKNQEGREERYNLNKRIYVYLPYINVIAKQKPMREFNEVELILYVFKNGISHDIMRMKSKVIEIMKEKLEMLNEDEELLDIAYKRALNRRTQELDKRDMYNQGKKDEKRENVIKMLKYKYPLEDISFIEDLTYEQYEEIFMMILQGKTLTDIERYIVK